jgi:hypothetical protein
MQESEQAKPYGIAVKLPDNDPFCADHLLGESWSATRWFETREQRDQVLIAMRRQPGNYRKGDTPSVVYSEIDPQ